ncbi:MAG TPA: hypothetical protein DCZ44_06345 [Flavobacteriaceae bacterium]|nr:hypothetical protein [Flavobacteriaceae bacterium]
MKLMNFRFFIIATLAIVTLNSCQKEEDIIIDPTDNSESFNGSSNFAANLLSATQNDGSIDNLIDGTSCFSIDFPVDVVANGQQVTLNSIDDLQLVEDIFNLFIGDTDLLNLVFPLTLISEDFSEQVVNDLASFNALVANCTNDVSDDLSCLDFQFPITGTLYNASNEQTGTLSINNASEWFNFLSGLSSDVYVAINYPITVLVGGTSTTVNSNTELTDIFNQTDCSNSGGNTTTAIEDELTDGVWYVTYFFDDYDETSDFNGYSFTFNADGTALADNGMQTTGSWSTYTDSGVAKLDLNFGPLEPLEELMDDWEILSVSSDEIQLRDLSGNGSTDYLTFGRTPNSGGGGSGETNALIELLVTDQWYVNLMEEDLENDTCDYVDFTFTYNLDGTVQAVSTSRTVDGFWAVSNSSSGLELILNFNYDGQEDPFEDLNDDWDVLFYDTESIQLEDVSGGNGDVERLNFARTPYTGCGNTLPETIEGKWILEDFQNTMYIFQDGLRYTVYCADPVCDWENLGIDDAMPNPNPYTFVDDVLTIDIFFGNTWIEEMDFRCGNNVVQYELEDVNATYDVRWFRPGYDISQCN